MTPALIAHLLATSERFRVDEFGQLEKRCSRCRDYWPADLEFFFSATGSPCGLHTYCKACYLEKRYPAGRPTQAIANRG